MTTDHTSQRLHERNVYHAEQKAKAEQALRNIKNGTPLHGDFLRVENYIKTR